MLDRSQGIVDIGIVKSNLIEEMVLMVISGMSEVRRTGNKSVYSNRGASLADVSRAKIEGVVENLVACGRLVEADGIISLA